mmetsp:Transcript_15743/g.40586  ORF Transcript_15743/g.40586 Transcript_15743/m.40586 type:complete len:220 (-) Transcript_15743:691-1350(-)
MRIVVAFPRRFGFFTWLLLPSMKVMRSSRSSAFRCWKSSDLPWPGGRMLMLYSRISMRSSRMQAGSTFQCGETSSVSSDPSTFPAMIWPALCGSAAQRQKAISRLSSAARSACQALSSRMVSWSQCSDRAASILARSLFWKWPAATAKQISSFSTGISSTCTARSASQKTCVVNFGLCTMRPSALASSLAASTSSESPKRASAWKPPSTPACVGPSDRM